MSHNMSPYAAHRFNPDESNEAWANLNSFINDGDRVLDVGCSTGNFAAMLAADRGCDVVGVDLNPADIAEARTKFDSAYVMDITDRAQTEKLGRFDAIIFADVLEHLADPRAVLRSVRELLTPSGSVVFSIPNMAHTMIRLELLGGEFPYTRTGLLDATHLHFYDRREIDQLFADSGFAISHERPVIAELTRQWVTNRLSQLSLTPTDRFWKHLEETDSHVYQYVGRAVVEGALQEGVDQPTVRVRLSADRVVRRLAVAAEERAAAAEGRASAAESAAAEAGARAAKAEDRLRSTQVRLDTTSAELRHLRAHLAAWKEHPIASTWAKVTRHLRSKT